MSLARKVSKIGNSLGITMTEAIREVGLEKGDSVIVNVRNNEIIIKRSQFLPDGIDPEFLEIINIVMDKYDETFKGLKDR